MYAIVRAGGRQEKVAVGDVVEINRVPGDPGTTVQFPALLLVADDSTVTSAPQALQDVAVTAEVLEHTKGPKIRIFKYKNKTGQRKRQGHRQPLTRLRVTAIESGA